MGIIQIYDLGKILKKHFVRIVAVCLAVALAMYFFTAMTQTYTCTLNYRYNYPAAAEGKAPDGVAEMNPYELQNPAVIQAAINHMSPDQNLSVEGLRSNMSISTIITSLDQEVTESAAVMGEKYEVQPVEFQLDYSYSADLGEDFGQRMFDAIIKAYDDFVITEYYNKEHIPDFMKALSDVEVDYLESADIIYDRISDIISYLDDMADWYPQFRSVRTGYTFADLSLLYSNLRDTQHAKYHGNIRAGNLAKDSELTIKNYAAKIDDLKEDYEISQGIAENYKAEIKTFYDSYKAAGLYNQADTVQISVDSTNNRDVEIFRDYENDFDQLVNTYDKIVTEYTRHAADASEAKWNITEYTNIINDYTNDRVDEATKESLLTVNETILSDMAVLSSAYSKLANTVIDEFFSDKVSTEIQYLISTDISADKSPMINAILSAVIVGILLAMAVIFFELVNGHLGTQEDKKSNTDLDEEALNKLDEEHRISYEQYKNGFSEFYLLYQPMLGENGDASHFEVFLRWENEKLGNVSPLMIIDYFSDLKLIKELNRWIFTTVCRDIPKITRRLGKKPVIHVNCLYSEIEDFGLNEMLLENIKQYGISPSSLCIELDGNDIVSSMEDIMTLKDMGLRICVDHFEAKESENEILQVIEPEYVKVSSDVFNHSDLSTSEEEMYYASLGTASYFAEIIKKCEKKRIKVCICGIESRVQGEIISRMGFSFRQGFYYCRPLSLQECLDQVTSKKAE